MGQGGGQDSGAALCRHRSLSCHPCPPILELGKGGGAPNQGAARLFSSMRPPFLLGMAKVSPWSMLAPGGGGASSPNSTVYLHFLKTLPEILLIGSTQADREGVL